MVTSNIIDVFIRSAGSDVELLGFEPIPFGLSFRVRVKGDGKAKRINVFRDGRDLSSNDLAQEAGSGAKIWAQARLSKQDARRRSEGKSV